MAALVVGEAPGGAAGQAMGVEMVFRHIDADGVGVHLFRASACHSGLSPEYPSRPTEIGQTTGRACELRQVEIWIVGKALRVREAWPWRSAAGL
jgi:hypothetical protein